MTNGKESMSLLNPTTKDNLDIRMQLLFRRVEELTQKVEKMIEEEQRKIKEFYECFTNK